jgi:hypothetical protein
MLVLSFTALGIGVTLAAGSSRAACSLAGVDASFVAGLDSLAASANGGSSSVVGAAGSLPHLQGLLLGLHRLFQHWVLMPHWPQDPPV